MKRLGQTLTAAALAGALTLAGTTAAGAQSETSTPSSPTTPAAADSSTSKPAAPEPDGIPAPATIEHEGVTWFQSTKDPAVYVNDAAQVDAEITPEMRTASEAMLKDYYAAPMASSTTSAPALAGKLAWLALPAALVIGGVTWYLSKDGKTYVQSPERAKEEPNTEEKAASEKLLAEHAAEVTAQGGKTATAGEPGAPTAPGAAKAGTDAKTGAANTGARGMAAQTGDNTAARALIALAIAALAGAAAFIARRKFV